MLLRGGTTKQPPRERGGCRAIARNDKLTRKKARLELPIGLCIIATL